MLRVIENTSSARTYFKSADYYSESQELDGFWHGRGAARLGLFGHIEQEDWDALCDNLDPNTGKSLTVRRKDNRRIGYDFSFHAPKSLSVLYAMTQDEQVLTAFRDAVNETMNDIETEAQTRVRSKGRNEDRTTGNLTWGEWVHLTGRPVDGVPDPHLHAHCFAFNATWDDVEARWKAGQFGDLKAAAPFHEAVFHSRLAGKLQDLGIPIVRTKEGWEVDGISARVVDEFSRRTRQIEALAVEHGIKNPKELDKLGARTRQRKAKNLTMDELREVWSDRMAPDDRDDIARVAKQISGTPIARDERAAAEAIRYAIDHRFERNAVESERNVLRVAIRQAIGAASPEKVADLLNRADLISATMNGKRVLTTRSILAEERSMVEFARNGLGSCRALNENPHVFKRQWLSDEQRNVVNHILQSRDRIIMVYGGAGTGKTSLAQEAVAAIEGTGKQVVMCAPSAIASRGVLRAEGFDGADTVARLLEDEKLQAELKDQVLWVDEAGLLGSRSMARLLEIAKRQNSRIILQGDGRQHGAVERGAVLRLLKDAGVVPVEIRDIKRQQGAYKAAVRDISENRLEAGFAKLDELGWIYEGTADHRHAQIAADYFNVQRKGDSALIVAPTHAEGRRITDEVRTLLKENEKIGTDEHVFETLTPVNLTEAERRDRLNLSSGDILVFHQNARHYTKGDRVRVGDGELPLDQSARFQVYHARTLNLAAGDLVKVTRNGKTADGKHALHNGSVYQVKGFGSRGDILLTNGWRVSKDFGFLTHGYVVTSQASQSRTVDHVLIGMGPESFPAMSRNGFYVAASRGRKSATIYTHSKTELLYAVRDPENRLNASDLLTQRLRQRHFDNNRISALERAHSLTPEREREG